MRPVPKLLLRPRALLETVFSDQVGEAVLKERPD